MRLPNAPTQARTTIAVSTLAECPFSIAGEYAKEYLRRAEAGGPEALVRVPWFGPLPALAHRVRLTFGVHTDVSERGRSHEEIRFRWSSGTRLLPNFRGTASFRIEAARTRIFIDGSYDVPFGLRGRWLDWANGRRVARASLQDLADRVARHLGERERAWRSSKGLEVVRSDHDESS